MLMQDPKLTIDDAKKINAAIPFADMAKEAAEKLQALKDADQGESDNEYANAIGAAVRWRNVPARITDVRCHPRTGGYRYDPKLTADDAEFQVYAGEEVYDLTSDDFILERQPA